MLGVLHLISYYCNSKTIEMNTVVIVSAARTPIGSFMGALSTLAAPKLGSLAIKGALEKINLSPEQVEEVYMGHVVQAGTGQAPARQAAWYAGIPYTVPCTTVNKVCASGMKAIMQAAQAIALGENSIAVAGGMENMSLIPHYTYLRRGLKLGSAALVDGLQKDGLVDVYNQQAMGVCADTCAERYHFSREAQDAFAIQSYKRAAEAWENGKFYNEVVPVTVPQPNGNPLIISEDEAYKQIRLEKIPLLPPAFSKKGTSTAANASTINDGAAAVVLMSAQKASELHLTALATIKGYADAAQEPEWFTTAPAKALPKALERAKTAIDEIDFFEINEAFSVVAMANMKLLGLEESKVNIHGGAVALGHPLGCSGARITVTLLTILAQQNARLGAAAICNGGGGASALILERK